MTVKPFSNMERKNYGKSCPGSSVDMLLELCYHITGNSCGLRFGRCTGAIGISGLQGFFFVPFSIESLPHTGRDSYSAKKEEPKSDRLPTLGGGLDTVVGSSGLW